MLLHSMPNLLPSTLESIEGGLLRPHSFALLPGQSMLRGVRYRASYHTPHMRADTDMNDSVCGMLWVLPVPVLRMLWPAVGAGGMR